MLALLFVVAAQSGGPPMPLEDEPMPDTVERVEQSERVDLGPREPPTAFTAILGGAGAAGLGAALAVSGGLGALYLANGDPGLLAFGAGILVISPLITTAFASAGVTALYDGEINQYIGAAGASVAGCGAAYACASAIALIPLLALGGGSPGLGSCNNCGGLNGCSGNDPCQSFDNSGKFRVRDEINGAALGAGIGFGTGATVGFFVPIFLTFIGAPLPPMVEPVGTNPTLQGFAIGGGLAVLGAALGAGIGVGVEYSEKPIRRPRAAVLEQELNPEQLSVAMAH